MLAPRIVIFTASNLLGSSPNSVDTAVEALTELGRRNIPLVLSTQDTRAQIEVLRRKIEHAHPFITEGGGGLFLPDGYFALRLEGAQRVGRYFCVPFGRPAQEATEAIEDIAEEAEADVVRYAEMSAREIARNTGMSLRDAEASREREFSERFFLAGNTEEAAPLLEKIASERKWQVRAAEHPFWEVCCGNDQGKAVRYLMRFYREALRSRIRSVGIGSSLEDLPLLAASDQPFILPLRGNRFDRQLAAKVPNATQIDVPGPLGWNRAILNVLNSL